MVALRIDTVCYIKKKKIIGRGLTFGGLVMANGRVEYLFCLFFLAPLVHGRHMPELSLAETRRKPMEGSFNIKRMLLFQKSDTKVYTQRKKRPSGIKTKANSAFQRNMPQTV